jgi:hypothetical protein
MDDLHRHLKHHLKLKHHRHTGKVLHHKHTSYRGLAVVLGLAGLMIIGTTVLQHVAADSLITVSGTLEVPAPTAGAIITQPADDSTTASADTLVAGNCPITSPQPIEVITMDNTVVGSAVCDSNNTFSMPVRLTPGDHAFVVRTFSITSQQGPDSQPVRVTYQPKGQADEQTALQLTTKAPFSVLGTDHTAIWNGTITGGSPPYHIIIDWGDGNREEHSLHTANQQYAHRYATLVSYNAIFAISDDNGNMAQQQYAATAYTALPAARAALTGDTTSDSGTGTAVSARTMAGIYGLFMTTVAVSGIIWLEAKHAARQHALAFARN